MGDSAYGSAEMLGWLVYENRIEPHVTMFDRSLRKDGTFSPDDFTYDHASDVYRCLGGKMLTTTGTLVNDGATMLYRASKYDCQVATRRRAVAQKRWSAKYHAQSTKVLAIWHNRLRDLGEGRVSRRLRKKIGILFAYLKRILKLDRLRLRGPTGVHDEFLLAATAQNLRKLAKLVPLPKPKSA